MSTLSEEYFCQKILPFLFRFLEDPCATVRRETSRTFALLMNSSKELSPESLRVLDIKLRELAVDTKYQCRLTALWIIETLLKERRQLSVEHWERLQWLAGDRIEGVVIGVCNLVSTELERGHAIPELFLLLDFIKRNKGRCVSRLYTHLKEQVKMKNKI